MLRQLSKSLCVCLLFWRAANAQVPGDGILDIYYFPDDDLTVDTTEGLISRPAGTLTVDTDGTDMVTLLFEGPEAIECVPGLHLCADGRLPLQGGTPSEWTIGFINGAWQLVQTHPLNGPGFTGVIGEYEDPFNIYPDDGVASFAAGLGSDDFGDNVTIVPEPVTASLIWICVCALLLREHGNH
jgi:hypothetical protein